MLEWLKCKPADWTAGVRCIPIKHVLVNGKRYRGFDNAREMIRREGFQGTAAVTAQH